MAMTKIRTIKLGKVHVPAGLPADLVGDFPHYYGPQGLDPGRFRAEPSDPPPWNDPQVRQGIAAWPREPSERELLLINFGTAFLNFKAVLDRVRQEGYPVAGFPELCAITGRAAELWDLEENVPYAAATDPNSLWRNDVGGLCAPCLFCFPVCRGLNACWVVSGWDEDDWFVVGVPE